MWRCQLVAELANYSLSTVTLACQFITGGIQRSYRMTITRFTTNHTVEVPVAVPALLTVVPHHICFTFALARDAVTDWQLYLLLHFRTEGVTATGVAVLGVAPV